MSSENINNLNLDTNQVEFDPAKNYRTFEHGSPYLDRPFPEARFGIALIDDLTGLVIELINIAFNDRKNARFAVRERNLNRSIGRSSFMPKYTSSYAVVLLGSELADKKNIIPFEYQDVIYHQDEVYLVTKR